MQMKIMKYLFLPIIILAKKITLRLDSSWVLFQMKSWHFLDRPVRPQDHFALLSAKTVLVYLRMTSKFLTQKVEYPAMIR